MRKFFSFLFLAFALAFLFWQKDKAISKVNLLLSSRCEIPIRYRIGRVDEGFKTNKETFLAQCQQAAGIWGKVYGKDLFVLDPQAADLTVNLVYNERQSALDEIEKLQKNLSSGKSSLEAMIKEHQALSRNFETRLAAFQKEVNFWNQRGGAPPQIYEKLLREQEELKAEAERLNALAQKLNLSVADYNLQVGEFNKSVQSFSQAIRERPEAGLYAGDVPKIDIYLTVSEKELIHTLAHEFGHALGLEHVDDPQTIMYPFSSEVVEPSLEEINALETICEERVVSVYLKQLWENFSLGEGKLSQLGFW